MHKHDCGCQTAWDDDGGHPVYLKACSMHRHMVPEKWPSAPRKPVKASA